MDGENKRKRRRICVSSPWSDVEEDYEELASYLRDPPFTVYQEPEGPMKTLLDDPKIEGFCMNSADSHTLVTVEDLQKARSGVDQYRANVSDLATHGSRMEEQARLHRKHGEGQIATINAELEKLRAQLKKTEARLAKADDKTMKWSERETICREYHAGASEAGTICWKEMDRLEEMAKTPLNKRQCANMTLAQVRSFTGLEAISSISAAKDRELQKKIWLLKNHGYEMNPLCPVAYLSPAEVDNLCAPEDKGIKSRMAFYLGYTMSEIESCLIQHGLEAFHNEKPMSDTTMSAEQLRTFLGLPYLESVRCAPKAALANILVNLEKTGFAQNPLCPTKRIPSSVRCAIRPVVSLYLGYSLDEIAAAGFSQAELFEFQTDVLPNVKEGYFSVKEKVISPQAILGSDPSVPSIVMARDYPSSSLGVKTFGGGRSGDVCQEEQSRAMTVTMRKYDLTRKEWDMIVNWRAQNRNAETRSINHEARFDETGGRNRGPAMLHPDSLQRGICNDTDAGARSDCLS
uniref:Uncharacterized protein n=1 Tax=Entomoneis paludosa TaxID=265537 RepID=A0A7S2YK30_9STRA|mmetsp:Transcript_35876/g.74612  ORF Transcript_35876/g.74612 Transcript_35876/m.74612 type:complete len:518 (+) Transcript_35876:639-2192(+)